MKKIIIGILFLLTFSGLTQARKIEGYVKCGNRVIRGVVISDGKNFAVTDKHGHYNLKTTSDTSMIFVVTPSGYVSDYSSGSAKFYYIAEPSLTRYDFELQRFSTKKGYSLFAISDPQVKNSEQLANLAGKPLQDLIGQAKLYGKENPVVCLVLGDIAWGDLNIYPDYKAVMAQIGVPVYHVIGNHDHNPLYIEDKAKKQYEKYFGPSNYAFHLGKDVVIVLDNIIYKGNKKYEEGYSEETLIWLKNYLKFVPKGRRLFIAQHSPVFLRWGQSEESYKPLTSYLSASFGYPHPNCLKGKTINGTKDLFSTLKDYKVEFLSGHTHIQNNYSYDSDIMEHNIPSICGAWWDSRLCSDGTPRGYEIFAKKDNDLTWAFHPIDYKYSSPIEVINLGQSKLHPNSIIVNIRDYDSDWNVEWYEDGAYMGRMKMVEDISILYEKEINAVYPKGDIPKYRLPNKNIHFFAATPSQYARKVVITIKSRFGKEWKYVVNVSDYLDVQAHRGGAGLMPENTISAMKNAIDLGVNTLEFDLQITSDSKVVVSHDPYFHYNYATRPDGTEVKKGEPKEYIYTMPYDSVAKYDVGLKANPRWLTQTKLHEKKPLASELIDFVEKYTEENGLTPMRYNIEIKSAAEKGEGTLWPHYKEFVDICVPLLLSKKLGDRLVVQCFDTRALEYMHSKYPELKLSYLTDEDQTNYEDFMNLLSFTPDWLSPHYSVVTRQMVDRCHREGIKIVPWTVDSPNEIRNQISMGIDAIISNYPDRVLTITRGK